MNIFDHAKPFEVGMVVINPNYSPKYASLDNKPNAECAWMLCVVAAIIPNKQRHLGYAIRLESLKERWFITNSSKKQLMNVNRDIF